MPPIESKMVILKEFGKPMEVTWLIGHTPSLSFTVSGPRVIQFAEEPTAKVYDYERSLERDLRKLNEGQQAVLLAQHQSIFDPPPSVYERARRGDFNRSTKAEIERAFLEFVNLSSHPKGHAAFEKAWDIGHGMGIMEVLHELQELAELMAPWR